MTTKKIKISELRSIVKQVMNEQHSLESKQLANMISDSISQVDDSLSYKDFAQAVASVLIDNYGEHNYEPFINELRKSLT